MATNNLLMIINMNTDAIARLSLIISIVAVMVSVVSAIAAIFAAFHSKGTTTKGKLARAEEKPRPERVGNTVSTVDARMHQQEEQETSRDQAQSVSISIEGEATGEVPLELLIKLQDPSVRVSRVERLTKAGRSLGSSPCKPTNNDVTRLGLPFPQPAAVHPRCLSWRSA